MRKVKLTVGIIAKNEEENIAACISTVKGWADEIIVVDGFSTDRTVEIAASMGAKIVEHRFEGDFSIERNIAMDNASGEWVLHLDADDRGTEGFRKKFDKIVDQSSDIMVFSFKRQSFFLGHMMRHGGWYHSIPNLVRKGPVRFEGRLHERPVYDGRSSELGADVEHHPYRSITQYMDRHNRYSSIKAEELFSQNNDSLEKTAGKNAVRKTFKSFWKTYVKKGARKDGMYGLVFSVLFAFVHFLVWIKYWELCQAKKRG